MKCIYSFAALCAAVLFCAGCAPQRITVSPGATGVVLDANTRAPLPDAKVVMAYSQRQGWPDEGTPTMAEVMTNMRPPVVLTGERGEFYLPRQRTWVINEPMAEWHPYGTLVILKDGYEAKLVPMTDMDNTDLVMQTFLMTPGKMANDK